jgi:hypothetical protein
MLKKNYRRFNLILIPLVAVNLLSIALFNIVVDPYEVLSTLNKSDLNQSKLKRENPLPVPTPLPKAVNKPVVKTTPQLTLTQRSKYRAERFKLNLARLSITRINPKTILLGTSTAFRLSPNHPALTNQPVYNLGLAGAKMHDIRSYFEDILSNHPDLNQVVIGLDFYSFGGPDNPIHPQKQITATNPITSLNPITDESSKKTTTEVRRNKYSTSLEELLKINFSWDTFNASLKKIMANSMPNQPITKGQLDSSSKNNKDTKSSSKRSKLDALHVNLNFSANEVKINDVKPLKPSTKFVKTSKQNAKTVNPIKKNNNFVQPIKKTIPLKPSKKLLQFQKVIGLYLKEKTFYKNYNLSPEELNSFKKIIEICRKKKISVRVFFSPVHAAQLEAIYTAGLWSDFEDWKRQVVAITPAWDFSDYSNITTEPISDDMENFVDSVHYDEQIGALILNRLYNYHKERVPSNFGPLITSTNIEAHLAEIRAERQAWLKTNQATVQFVQAIKKQTNPK